MTNDHSEDAKEKMSRKKFLIIVCSIYFVFYIVCKLYLLFALDTFINDDLLDVKYFDAETIKLEINKDNDKEMLLDDFYINTLKLEEFEEINHIREGSYEVYEFLHETDKDNAYIYLAKDDNLITKINDYDENSIFYSLNHFPVYLSDISKKSFLNKHDITDEVDLMKYIRTREKKTSNLFTPIYTVKERYFFYLIENNIPNVESSFKFIDGTYKGYVMRTNNMVYYLFDMGNGEVIYMTLYNLDYFDNNKINEILSNLVIK